MTRRTAAPAGQWPRLMVDTSRLWADANMVMMLRTWRMMSGGTAAVTEAERMVGEKLAAGFELAGALAGAAATGRAPTPEAAARKALTVYSRKVKANRRRLG
ncbi:MAG TPA: hypothetical protein VFO42_08370 [Sphingomicrobium sp.]|nr:hypothetical protein [Sphingomicrobium sp.]